MKTNEEIAREGAELYIKEHQPDIHAMKDNPEWHPSMYGNRHDGLTAIILQCLTQSQEARELPEGELRDQLIKEVDDLAIARGEPLSLGGCKAIVDLITGSLAARPLASSPGAEEDKLKRLRAALCEFYTAAYRHGHEDTVEARYTDVHRNDRDTYFADHECVSEAVDSVLSILPVTTDKLVLDWMNKHWHDWQDLITTDSDGWAYRYGKDAWMEATTFRSAVLAVIRTPEAGS
jgi:hypothetical protein